MVAKDLLQQQTVAAFLGLGDNHQHDVDHSFVPYGDGEHVFSSLAPWRGGRAAHRAALHASFLQDLGTSSSSSSAPSVAAPRRRGTQQSSFLRSGGGHDAAGGSHEAHRLASHVAEKVAWATDAALDVQRLHLWKEARRALVGTVRQRTEAEIFCLGALLGGAVLLSQAAPALPAAARRSAKEEDLDLDPAVRELQVRRRQGPRRTKAFPGAAKRSGSGSGGGSSSGGGSGGRTTRRGRPRGEVSEAGSGGGSAARSSSGRRRQEVSKRSDLEPCFEAGEESLENPEGFEVTNREEKLATACNEAEFSEACAEA
eukprot:TRINITY_DN74765_c0_g1_i1.p1 TRINITY_DN74765_c0_g1~~TRINITY_DN74765_c0_g1_i1.p1  ORF type:complete len:314 (-),score=76.00 TRINITY_DN74765_c0_g1_i1:68-1009(-)